MADGTESAMSENKGRNHTERFEKLANVRNFKFITIRSV